MTNSFAFREGINFVFVKPTIALRQHKDGVTGVQTGTIHAAVRHSLEVPHSQR
jgi:hypothetical protein